MSCAIATHANGPRANPWPPDPEEAAKARRLAHGMSDAEWAALTAPFEEEG